MERRFALIFPDASRFDRDALLATALTDPAIIVDPHAEVPTLIVTNHPATARSFLAELHENPMANLSEAALVIVGPHAITTDVEFADRDILGKVRALLEPMIVAHAPQIVNAEFGTDVTAKYRDDIAALFG